MKKFYFFLAISIALSLLFFPKSTEAATNIGSCGILSTASETYILTQDVSSDGICFAVSANYITLDLNGHTVTYGNAAGNHYYGVAIPMSYYNSVSQTMFPGLPAEAFKGAQHVTIMNGTLNQGSGGGEQDHAIYGRPGNYVTVHGITSTVYGKDSRNIYFDYGHDNNIYDNIAYNNVASITSRHQGHEVIGVSSDAGNTKIHGNTIIGGPQYGIRITQNSATDTGYEIYGNTISQNAKVANPYGISVHVNNAKVYNNTITPQNGRGIHLAACSNVEVYNNTIVVKEGANPEYSPGWSQGIKIENGLYLKVYGNNITAYAGTVGGQDFGHAYALDITLSNGVDSHDEVYNNTFTAITSASDRTATALHLVDVRAGNGLNLHNNTFRSNNFNVMFDYDSGSEVVSKSDTFELTGTPINYHALNFYTGPNASLNNIFLDSHLGSGVSLQDMIYRVAGGNFSYSIQQYLNITVTDLSNSVIGSASISIKDKNGTQIASGTTDSLGYASFAVNTIDAVAKPLVTTDNMPHTVIISKTGYTTVNQAVVLDQKRELAITLTATDEPATPSACMESWVCQDWSACTSGLSTRVCTDQNYCGTTTDRPSISQSCQSSPACLESWECTAWSDCVGGSQTRSCSDANSCGTQQDKPLETYQCSPAEPQPDGTVIPRHDARDLPDTINPSTIILSGPSGTLARRQAEFRWLGTDDQTAQEYLTYSYALDNNDWSVWASGTSVILRELRNGRHTFSVKARDGYGNSDQSPAEISFTVRKESYVVAASGVNGGPLVRIFNSAGKLISQFFAFEKSFRGGVTVTTADLGGDGVDEVIVSTGPGHRPEVRVFRKDGSFVNSFLAYQAGFRGGVNVGAGDFDGDGKEEIVTAPMAGGGPNIRVFGFRDGTVKPIDRSFMAYDSKFRGGVSVAAVDIEGDGVDEIITAPQSMGGPQVRVFGLRSGRFQSVSASFMAYDSKFRGGVVLAAGQLNASSAQEIISGIFSKGGPQVRVFGRTRRGTLGLIHPGFFAFTPGFRGGVSLAAADINLDGTDEIVVGVGSQSDALVRIYQPDGRRIIREFYAWPKGMKFGLRLSCGE